MPGDLLKVVDMHKVEIRDDVRDALLSSADMVHWLQIEQQKPHILFAVDWTQKNIPEDDTVKLMGYAGLGRRTLGAHILGLFVMTDRTFAFVRDGSRYSVPEGKDIQVFEAEKIFNAEENGMLGLRKLTFHYQGEDFQFDRIQKTNLKRLINFLKKEK